MAIVSAKRTGTMSGPAPSLESRFQSSRSTVAQPSEIFDNVESFSIFDTVGMKLYFIGSKRLKYFLYFSLVIF